MKSASEILLYLLLDLAIIITAARSLGALARRLGQPAVIGEIIAGIVLGPTLLGAIAPGLPASCSLPKSRCARSPTWDWCSSCSSLASSSTAT